MTSAYKTRGAISNLIILLQVALSKVILSRHNAKATDVNSWCDEWCLIVTQNYDFFQVSMIKAFDDNINNEVRPSKRA